MRPKRKYNANAQLNRPHEQNKKENDQQSAINKNILILTANQNTISIQKKKIASGESLCKKKQKHALKTMQ